MEKLIILPSWCESLGGMTVSLSMTIAGFDKLQSLDRISVLVKANSLLENYLQHQGQGDCLQPIVATDGAQFYERALKWVAQQPRDYPLLIENCTTLYLLPILARNILQLKLSRRRVYHCFRDAAYSYNLGGNLLRKLIFAGLAPGAICNSQFTSEKVAKNLGLKIKGILYPPLEREKFSIRSPKSEAPSELKPILASGAKIMLTPTRISKPGQINDKNLRGLILVLAKLKELGANYHSVIIGQDHSPEQINSKNLLQLAMELKVSERLTILPPSFSIPDYYQHANVLVTLAPREPFGRTVVEAVSSGVPVVGSCTGGIGEILSNFAPHWMVNPEDPQAVAQTIIELERNYHDQTSQTLLKGQQWIEANCNPQEYARKLAKIVDLDLKPETVKL
ncbi:glycosyltransferase family 4 protein [Pleurocapsa sp. PCC 7319]|uniref:glycosyltransferase family 4 protein n=1 Tax=Pleurocapsa sp. PCC 7319 TaxID=118161 RepID=UPI000360B6EB|nr:glycosyltransferase family 4 protein [Pleurocapsa sp. PCC 7319]